MAMTLLCTTNMWLGHVGDPRLPGVSNHITDLGPSMGTCFCDVHVVTRASRSIRNRLPPTDRHLALQLCHTRCAPTWRRRTCCSSSVSSNYAAETLAGCHEASTSGRQGESGFTIRPVRSVELEQVAWLRAEAYYEDQVGAVQCAHIACLSNIAGLWRHLSVYAGCLTQRTACSGACALCGVLQAPV